MCLVALCAKPHSHFVSPLYWPHLLRCSVTSCFLFVANCGISTFSSHTCVLFNLRALVVCNIVVDPSMSHTICFIVQFWPGILQVAQNLDNSFGIASAFLLIYVQIVFSF